MVNLYDVAIVFNSEITRLRPDCYAVVEDGGHVLAVWLDGRPVVRITAQREVNMLLKAGYSAYSVLKGCFPGGL